MMNATIQEIEGIDDYWGPAFRSVYEGEGHEAFVQQLDERIVQHDKEIEKLCNFHYQPKKRKWERHHSRRPIEPAGVSHESTECLLSNKAPRLQDGHSKTSSERLATRAEKHYISEDVASSYNDDKNKKHYLDPKRLGGYSNVFPEAGSTRSHNMSASAYKTHNLNTSSRFNDSDDESFVFGYTDRSQELDEMREGSWEVKSAELSCEEYDEIFEYHALAQQQKNQKLTAGNGPDNNLTKDLRLYLRNRKQCRKTSTEHYQNQSPLTSKPYQSQQLSVERSQSSYRRGTSIELPNSNRRDLSDQASSNDGQYDGNRTDSENVDINKRRSRRDAMYERYNSENRYGHHSQNRDNSAKRQHVESRYAFSDKSDRVSYERHCDKTRFDYRDSFHASANHQRKKLSPIRNCDPRARGNDSNELKKGKTRHAAVSIQGKHTFNEHNGREGCHNSAERQHRESQNRPSNQREYHRISKEHNFGQRQHDCTERYNGESRSATAGLQRSENSPNGRHIVRTHCSSVERNGDRRHAYASRQEKERSHGDHLRPRDESRYASTSQQREGCASNNVRQFGRYDSSERKNCENLHKSANQEPRNFSRKRDDSSGDKYKATSLQGDRAYKGRHSAQTRHDSADRHNGDRCHTSVSRQSTSHEPQCGDNLNGFAGQPRITADSQTSSNACDSLDKPQALKGNGSNLDPSNDLRSYLRSKKPKVDNHIGFDGMHASSNNSTVTVNCLVRDSSDNRGILEQHNDNFLNTSTEIQQNGGNQTSERCIALSELKPNKISDAKPDPIISTSSKECSMDMTAEVTADCTPLERSSPVRDENLNDSKSQLCSYLKSELVSREECAAVSRSHSTSSELQSSEHRGDNTNSMTIESHSDQNETDRRECSTPDITVLKTEPNGKTLEVVDASASVSDNVSTDCRPEQSFIENQCSLDSENIVKMEPNDNLSDPFTSEMTSADLPVSKSVLAEPPAAKNSPKQIPLTVYSKRHPEISLRPDTKVQTAATKSSNPSTSGQSTTSNLNDATQLNHNTNGVTNSIPQPNLEERERQLSLKICQNNLEKNKENAKQCHPNSTHSLTSEKKCHFNLSVRDVESINLSSIQLLPEAKVDTDVLTDLGNTVDSCHLNPLNNSGTGELNSVNAVTSRDPRLRPRQYCNSEHQITFHNPIVCMKNQLNSTVLTPVAPNHDPRLRSRHNGDIPYNQTSQNILTKVPSLSDFDPSNKNESITSWLCRVNEIAIICKWTDQQVVEFAMSKLVGNAKRWYEGFTSDLTWIEWQNKLEATFPFEENYGKMLSEMLNKTAKTGDSLEHYCIQKMTMLNRCSIRGKRAVECIIFGIEDETVKTVVEREKFNDPDKLLEYLRNVTKSSCTVNTELLYNDLLENP